MTNPNLRRKIETEAVERGRYTRAEEPSELPTPLALGRLACDVVIIGNQVEEELQDFQAALAREGLIAEE